MALTEYTAGTAFPGVVGRTTDESTPAWPQPLRAAAGAPNVLFVVLDDVGFGQLGCYGSPISTPNFDSLAAGGLLYTNMHTTALCSPSRSCIVTGRNHHANAMASINEAATGYPGYNGSMPFENGFLSEMLQQHGYSTYLVGKYHLLPSEFESPAGPFDRWPLGRGFERFYGFLGGDTSQWFPDLIMVVSDNGASAEGGPTGTTNELQFFNNAPEPLEDSIQAIDELGGPTTFNHYPWGWTWAGNTPFRRWKRETYRGGSSDPFLVHWPNGIKARGEIRGQYAHIIDMVPTVLDVLGAEPPATIRGVTQAPIHGVSFAHTFGDPAAPTRHRTQYFEMFGHRSIDHDGWRAVCPWPGPSFAEAGKPFGAPITPETLTDLDAHHWELYHVAEDPAENHDLAAEHRDKLIEMIAQWYVEAGKYNVLPIDGSALERFMAERPQIAEPRDQYIYRPGTQTVPFFAGPRVLNRPHAITDRFWRAPRLRGASPVRPPGMMTCQGGTGQAGPMSFRRPERPGESCGSSHAPGRGTM